MTPQDHLREWSAARALVRIAAPWCSPVSLPADFVGKREERNEGAPEHLARVFRAPVT
jgi:hypothetical protein